MSIDLLQLPTRHLLDKIGAGNHKPGSGSAAALNGILSCKLLMTVIDLTLDPKRPKSYANCKKEFEEIRNNVTSNISPKLENLFEEDSIQFDKAIQKRIERDNENNQKIKNDWTCNIILDKFLSNILQLPIIIVKRGKIPQR